MSRASLAEVKRDALRGVTLRYHHSSSLAVIASCATVKDQFGSWFGSVSCPGPVVVVFDMVAEQAVQGGSLAGPY